MAKPGFPWAPCHGNGKRVSRRSVLQRMSKHGRGKDKRVLPTKIQTYPKKVLTIPVVFARKKTKTSATVQQLNPNIV
jgi:hypothetical protein